MSDSAFAREIDGAIIQLGNDESYVRILVTRGTGPISLDLDTARAPTRIVFVEPLTPPPREAYVAGIGAITLPRSAGRQMRDRQRSEGRKLPRRTFWASERRRARGRGGA